MSTFSLQDLYKELVATKTKKGEFFKIITKLHEELSEECYEAYVDCDFLATVAALYPECIKSSVKHFLVVEEREKYTRGLTILQRQHSIQKTRVEIVTDFHLDVLRKLRRQMLNIAL